MVDDGAPVPECVFQFWSYDDHGRTSLHGSPNRGEEPFSSWDPKGRMLEFSRQFLVEEEGTCFPVGHLSNEFYYFGATIRCEVDGEIYAIKQPPQDFLFVAPGSVSCLQFFLGYRIPAVMIGDVWRRENGVDAMYDCIGEVLEMVSCEVVGGCKEVVDKDFQKGCDHGCRL